MPTAGSQLNVPIDPDKRERFKNKVRGQGLTVNEVINALIDSYLDSEDVSSLPNPSNLDEIVEEKVTEAIQPFTDKIEALSSRLKAIESEIGEKYHVPIDVESSPVEDEDKLDEGEGITTSTLSPIFDEPENEPITNDTPSDDDLPIDEDSEGDKGEIKGQSEKVTETGLTNQQLSDLLKVPKSTVEKWKTSLKKGETVKPRKYPNFMSKWKLGDDSLWYSIN